MANFWVVKQHNYCVLIFDDIDFLCRFNLAVEMKRRRIFRMWRISRPDALAVLEDELAKKSLRRYFSVLQNKKTAKFMIAKKLPAKFDDAVSLEKLWTKHATCTSAFRDFEREVDEGKNFEEILSTAQSYFELKIEIANRIVQSYTF